MTDYIYRDGFYYPKEEESDYLAKINAEERYVLQLNDDLNSLLGISEKCNRELVAHMKEKYGNRSFDIIQAIVKKIKKEAKDSGLKKTYTYDLGYGDSVYVTTYNNGSVELRDSGTGCTWWYEKKNASKAFEWARLKKQRNKQLNKMFGD